MVNEHHVKWTTKEENLNVKQSFAQFFMIKLVFVHSPAINQSVLTLYSMSHLSSSFSYRLTLCSAPVHTCHQDFILSVLSGVVTAQRFIFPPMKGLFCFCRIVVIVAVMVTTF